MLNALLALATVIATPATMTASIKAAQPGDTITAAAGIYGNIVVNRRTWSRPITLDLRKARAAVTVTKSEGLIILGGKTTSTADTGGKTYAYSFDFAKRITLKGPTIDGLRHAIQINRSQDIAVSSATMLRMTQDGITIGLSQRVAINYFVCRDFRPTPGTHPDCVQLWSRPGGITADVTISNGVAEGDSQGIGGFNHVRNGVNDGGFDRVFIYKNRLKMSFPQGLALHDCRACVVRDNIIETYPGAKWRTNINVLRGSVVQAGNTIGPKQ